MTIKRALKEAFGEDLSGKVKTDDKGNIDFDSAENQTMFRKALLDALNKSGYISLALLIASAWKIPVSKK